MECVKCFTVVDAESGEALPLHEIVLYRRFVELLPVKSEGVEVSCDANGDHFWKYKVLIVELRYLDI